MPATNRRPVGIALLVSGGLMLAGAVLTWTEVLPVPMQSRMIVGSTLFVAAVADVFIGLRFLGSSE